jgi:hypothetical protein
MKRFTSRLLGLVVFGSLVFLSPMNRSAEGFLKFGNTGKKPRMIFILVDMSGSTNQARQTVYREAFEKIYPSLGQGDRIVVGTITGRSFINFKPAVDVEIPEKSLWTNRIQFERKLTETKEMIQEGVEELLSQKKGTARTEILNSLNIADTIFHDEKRRKVLVILSDMIQDSREYNFARVEVTEDYIDRVIHDRCEHKFIPNLKDVKVYVAGASGKDSTKFRSIERFWSRYFEKSGADFSQHRYGHSLISFERES